MEQCRAAPDTSSRLPAARSLLCLVALVVTLLVSFAGPPRAHADVITPLAPRFHTIASGDIAFVANNSMTCPAGDTRCAAAMAGNAGGDANNLNSSSYPMAYVEIDSNPSTFDSTIATLSLPAGGAVLFAGLYWGQDVQRAHPHHGAAVSTHAADRPALSAAIVDAEPPGSKRKSE